MFLARPSSLLAAALALGLPAAAGAQAPPPAPPTEMPEVVVRGRAEDLLDSAVGASQGTIGQEELADLPLLRRGELLEAVPGMVVTQHSGDGKANQYFLRGFNLDHGTDFAFSVDGVPINLPSHAHGQGYADLNFLIPELVDTIEFKKGPFYPEVGDFSGAGAADIRLVRRLPEGLANLQLGSFGYARALLAESPSVGPGTLLYAFECDHYDGPWDLPESSNRYDGLLRYRWERGSDAITLTGSFYWAPFWHATDQVAQRAIDDHLVSRFGAIDPTDGGSTGRAALSVDWQRRGDDALTELVLYGSYYRLNLWSNFRYALLDPIDLDQVEQVDRRLTTGGELKRTWDGLWGSKRLENTVGIQLRNDAIPDSGLNHTAARRVLRVGTYDHVDVFGAGVYGRNRVQWTSWLRSEVGLRGDLQAIGVDSTTNAANSGTAAAGIVSPKAALVLGPWKRTEIYLDAGAGFHSNDARGVTITVDPAGMPQRKVPLLVRTQGAEIGVRTAILRGLASTASLWLLQSDSELTFDGESGDTQASGPSRKVGLEWASSYKPTGWLTLNADFAFTHARYLEPQVGADGQPGLYIANSIPVVVSAAAVVETPGGIFAGARLRYFSSQPLVEDDLVRQPGSTIVNVVVGYRFGKYEVSAEALNLLDSRSDDIAYYYASRLPDGLLASGGRPPEPTAGVLDTHVHPAEPFQLRASLTVHY